MSRAQASRVWKPGRTVCYLAAEVLVHRIRHRAAVAGAPVVMTLLALILGPGRAAAFCRTTTCAVQSPPASCVRDQDGCWAAGIPLIWPEQCLSFSVSGQGSPRLGLDYPTAQDLVQRAFSLWATASCPDGFPTIAFASRGPLMCERREYNPSGPNANAVLFRDSDWAHDPAAIALTTVTFADSTGTLLNADMEINSFGYDQLGPAELQFVVAHEAGHFLGLDHSPDPTALMFYRDSFDPTMEPHLAADDLAGLCAIYSPGRAVPQCSFEPPHGFAADCGGNVTAACAVAVDTTTSGAASSRAPAAFTTGLALALAVVFQRLRRRG